MKGVHFFSQGPIFGAAAAPCEMPHPLRLLPTLLLVVLAPHVHAQGITDETPLRPVTRTFALANARVVQAPGRVIEGATVVVRDGLIEAVGRDVAVPFDA